MQAQNRQQKPTVAAQDRAAGPGAIRPITDTEFAGFQELIRRMTGIHLGPSKRALLVGRLSRRLRHLGMTTFSQYYRHVTRNGDRERVHMIDAICTNKTGFFREPAHFDLLVEHIVPAWRTQADASKRPRRARAWSAACSTGEEPYTLAMVLFHHLPGWDIDILATDLSTAALSRARQARWPVTQAAELPAAYRRSYMLRGVRSQEGWMRADARLTALIRFRELNLTAPLYPNDGLYDLIWCRNVLIYFASDTRSAVQRRLIDRLAPGGYLFLGHAESLDREIPGMRCVIPTVYQRTEERHAP